MPTPIRDDTRENQLIRALLAIEFLAGYATKDTAMIYMIAHDVLGHCRNCANGQGFDLVEQCEADAKAKDIYDVEKMLATKGITL